VPSAEPGGKSQYAFHAWAQGLRRWSRLRPPSARGERAATCRADDHAGQLDWIGTNWKCDFTRSGPLAPRDPPDLSIALDAARIPD